LPEHSKGTGRLAWIDQLRTMVIVLVVNMHACVTYSHVGSWYVMDGPEPLPLDKIAFAILAGPPAVVLHGDPLPGRGLLRPRFAAQGGDREGFARERLFRLGAAHALLYMVVLNPFIRLR
jgi:glucan biosynthesis protein C